MNFTLRPLAALLLSGAPLLAQIINIPAIPTFAPAVTTGAVGLAASQTAQLNVVNLNTASAPATTTPTVPCQVQLEFWDSQGKLVKSLSIPNQTIPSLAPGATASLQIKLTDVTTNTSPLRTEIRGVVRRYAPSPATGVTTTPTPIAQPIAFYPASCTVATTLEIFDTATGVTQSLTSDMRVLENFTILPLEGATGR
jgi:hypothetical protein